MAELRGVVASLARRWSLTIGNPFEGTHGCSWVATAEHASGERVVLKIGVPHFEADHEVDGLRFWNGDPTVRLIEADESLNAMLLEWCDPGTSLALSPAETQDEIVASLLTRLWRPVTDEQPFRHLSIMVRHWCDEARDHESKWPDRDLTEQGIQVFQELARSARGDVLLATDLHAGNVLQATRQPWLVIDPKPFVGDPAYDATQHLFNRGITSHPQPGELIRSFARLLDVDAERVALWLFARAAAEPRDHGWEDGIALARRLRP
ncbi:MAG: aminoglycoside phosphotransferase family protein [Longimicrobiales bacterium]